MIHAGGMTSVERLWQKLKETARSYSAVPTYEEADAMVSRLCYDLGVEPLPPAEVRGFYAAELRRFVRENR